MFFFLSKLNLKSGKEASKEEKKTLSYENRQSLPDEEDESVMHLASTGVPPPPPQETTGNFTASLYLGWEFDHEVGYGGGAH